MKCKKCGAALENGAYFCPVCGTLAENQNEQNNPPPQSYGGTGGNQMNGGYAQSANQGYGAPFTPTCPNCGTPAQPGFDFCSQCGTRITGGAGAPFAPVPEKKSNTGVIVAVIIVGAVIFIGIIAAVVAFILNNIDPNPSPAPVQTTAPADTPIPAPTQVVYSAPVFNHISASSTRAVDYTSGSAVYYPVEYAVDGNYDTCWSPDRNMGLTPTITLSADTPQHVTGIRLSNGYFKTSETYTRNRRITRAEIKYAGGSKIVDMSINNYRVMQDIVFDRPVDTTYVEIHVLDTYYGDWKDICISEIEVY